MLVGGASKMQQELRAWFVRPDDSWRARRSGRTGAARGRVMA
ncbi:hypothetical protein KR76_00083 [Pimelobacter simplex]|uniref:Uncharacterized protein n=1 Tax=Nocardioides simplex TaxID=2045 RepID=A0A0C5XAJ5_NOCSI|nr:hypothetical protein KR76_00083 [Pimelobacter simplex]